MRVRAPHHFSFRSLGGRFISSSALNSSGGSPMYASSRTLSVLPLSRRDEDGALRQVDVIPAQIACLRDPQTVALDDQADQPIPVTVPVALECPKELVHLPVGQMLPNAVGIVPLITAMAQPDGTIKAVEVHVFAEPLRGIGEGHYGWDLMPNSTMTNAAVAQQVKKQDANTLMLKYKDGEKTIVVPSDATVVNLIPGDKADVVPGAKIFIPRWAKTADGTWEATVALVGRDRLQLN